MKITLFLFALITMVFQTAISQNFTNLRKLVKIHETHDTDILINNGFVQDTSVEHEHWYNDSTDEQIDFYDDQTVFSFTNKMIDVCSIGDWYEKSKSYSLLVFNKIQARPWWYSDIVSFKDGSTEEADIVKIKGHWVMMYYDPCLEMKSINVSKAD